MAVDKRHKNGNWQLPTNAQTGRIDSWDSVKIAILMDIRDELQSLNSLFRCPNFVGFPRLLRDIRRNTTRRKRSPRARVQ